MTEHKQSDNIISVRRINEMARKSMSIQIEESLQDAFRDKCKSENLKYSEVAEALLQAYVEGSINVAIETKYKVTPKTL